MSVDTLFSLAEIEEATQLPEVPRWVVEVNELLLFTYGGTTPEAADWWAVWSGRAGIAARTEYLAITPAGALLYIACDDEEEARFVAGHMVEKGCHPKAAKAQQIGKPITCKGCGERRPYFASATKRGPGRLCSGCWRAYVAAGCPAGCPAGWTAADRAVAA